jgi:uncharacterized OsmC-like protein
MNANELRALQAPLKEEFKTTPAAAQVTLSARGRLGENVTCVVDGPDGPIVAGLHPKTGGDGRSACSGDLLLQALVACAGVTLNAVSTAMSIELRSAEVRAEGDIDFRGTLGVSKDAPVGFHHVRLRFEVDSPATDEQLAKLLSLTERYCVVFQTLVKPAEITSTIVRVG